MPDTSFYFATFLHLIINLVYTIAALCAGVATFRFLDKRVFTEIDFVEEIKKGNLAASIFASSMIIFVALVVGLALRP